MKQIKFETTAGCEQILVTVFADGTVEVEGRPGTSEIWRPIRRVEVIEVREEGEMQ